jgi:hypothetical protein
MGAVIRILGIVLINGLSWLWGKLGKGMAWAGVAYFTFKGIGISTAFFAWLASNGLGSGAPTGFEFGAAPWGDMGYVVCALNGWIPVDEWWFLFKFIMSLRLSGMAVKIVARAFRG